MNINERFITFSPKSARLPYPQDLELGQDITVTIGQFPFIYNVVKVEFFDNQDDNMNVNYILNPRWNELSSCEIELNQSKYARKRQYCSTVVSDDLQYIDIVVFPRTMGAVSELAIY